MISLKFQQKPLQKSLLLEDLKFYKMYRNENIPFPHLFTLVMCDDRAVAMISDGGVSICHTPRLDGYHEVDVDITIKEKEK